jgi:hypothetical protein
MTTLQSLINSCESHLGDDANAVWAAADIEQWCRDGMADYSLHFPRTLSQTINCADSYEYDLSSGFLEIISVEYPDGQDPPNFLGWKDRLDDNFYGSDGYYDVIHKGSSAASTLVTSKNYGANGNDIVVLYLSTHDSSIAALTSLTVPDEHLHLVRNYVLWQAAVQLKIKEEADPTSNSSLLMSQYAINVDRARRAYVDALAKAVYATSKSVQISWQDRSDESTRIY